MTENTETKKEIKILAIESSCDETAAAVVVNGRDLRSNVISSQIALHTLYGGVVPEIASRKHIEKINQVIEQALSDAHMTLDDIGRYRRNRRNIWSGARRSTACRRGRSKGHSIRKKHSSCRSAPYRGTYQRKLYRK
mgnify:CR=1 FL=1